MENVPLWVHTCVCVCAHAVEKISHAQPHQSVCSAHYVMSLSIQLNTRNFMPSTFTDERFSQWMSHKLVPTISSWWHIQTITRFVCVCRALCYLKLERFTEAKQDCDAALKLEPTNKKAFYRRAMANKGLKVRRERRAIQDTRKYFIFKEGVAVNMEHGSEILNLVWYVT